MMLSVRLNAIAECVPEGKIVADIGTDHGYLPCALVERGVSPKAYACDIAKGPLEHARTAIVQAQLQDRIETILTPGLKDVPSDAQVIVIAGMGWQTARIILENDYERLERFDMIIVQVNREVASLREWIRDHGFMIHDEKIIEDRHTYQIVCFSKTEQPVEYTEEQILFGPVLMKQRNEVFVRYYSRTLAKLEKIIAQVSDEEKKDLLQKQIGQIQKLNLD